MFPPPAACREDGERRCDLEDALELVAAGLDPPAGWGGAEAPAALHGRVAAHVVRPVGGCAPPARG